MIEVPLHSRLFVGRVALIDDKDGPLVLPFRWHTSGSRFGEPYAAGIVDLTEGPRTVRMHRFIMGVVNDPTVVVDHRDHDHLNNQRSNLRVASNRKNLWNQRPALGARYKNVARTSTGWAARHPTVGHLGVFDDEVDAALAADAAAVEAYGEWAWLNVPTATPEDRAAAQERRRRPGRRAIVG